MKYSDLIPQRVLASGFRNTMLLLIEALEYERESSANSVPDFVLIGSRALTANLQKRGIDPSEVPKGSVPKLVQPEVSDEAITFQRPDCDFVAKVSAVKRQIENWRESGQLKAIYVRNHTKVVAIVEDYYDYDSEAENENEEDVDESDCDSCGTREKVWFCEFELLDSCYTGYSYEKDRTHSTNSSYKIAMDAVKSNVSVSLNFLGMEAVIPCASIPVLFAIKRSHIFYPIQWRKHIEIIHFLLEKFPDELNWNVADMQSPSAKLVYETRVKEMIESKGEPGKHIKLNVTNEEFFSDDYGSMERKRLYNHDALHERIAYKTRPLYESMKHDKSKAMLDRELFESSSEIDQLRLVREETMAIALERYLLPGRLSPDDSQEAYLTAFERVSTTLTKGWFRDFAAKNYPLIKECDIDLKPHINFIRAHPQDFKYEDTFAQKQENAPVIPTILQNENQVNDYESFEASGELLTFVKQFHCFPNAFSKRALFNLSKLLKYSQRIDKNTYRLKTQDVANAPEVKISYSLSITKAGWADEDDDDFDASKKGVYRLESFIDSKIFVFLEFIRHFDHKYSDSSCNGESGTYYNELVTDASAEFAPRSLVISTIDKLFGEDNAFFPISVFVGAVFHLLKNGRNLLGNSSVDDFFCGFHLNFSPLVYSNVGRVWLCSDIVLSIADYCMVADKVDLSLLCIFNGTQDWSLILDAISKSKSLKHLVVPRIGNFLDEKGKPVFDALIRAVSQNPNIVLLDFTMDQRRMYAEEEYGYVLQNYFADYFFFNTYHGKKDYVIIEYRDLATKALSICKNGCTIRQAESDTKFKIRTNIPVVDFPEGLSGIRSDKSRFSISFGGEIHSPFDYSKKINLLRLAYLYLSGRDLLDDFPGNVLPKTEHNLVTRYLFRNLEILDCDRFPLAMAHLWISIFRFLDIRQLKRIAESGTYLSAIAAACDLRYHKSNVEFMETHYPYYPAKTLHHLCHKIAMEKSRLLDSFSLTSAPSKFIYEESRKFGVTSLHDFEEKHRDEIEILINN